MPTHPTDKSTRIVPMHPAQIPAERLLAECSVRRTKRSGPGGQHRNKVETAIVLTHQPTGTRAEAAERRSQAQNHAQALFRLRVRLALKIRSPGKAQSGAAPLPSDLWQRRCGGGQIAVSPRHDDFPALLAEALDAIDLEDYDVASAAKLLSVTTSQLVKLLKIEHEALAIVNRQRSARKLPTLK